MACRRVKLTIKGVVQGVYFRESARTEAQRLDLAGSVRNCVDGSVEAEAEGDLGAVELFIAWCHRGPPDARVESVEVRDEVCRGDGAFEILS